MRLYSFEKLDVWQKSKYLVLQIYKLTSTFPESEKFGITNQLRRAAFSICNNVAEGTSRFSKKDKSRFIQIAFGSLMEVLNILIILKDLNLLSKVQFDEFRPLIEEIGNKLNALKSSFESS